MQGPGAGNTEAATTLGQRGREVIGAQKEQEPRKQQGAQAGRNDSHGQLTGRVPGD